MQTQTLFSLEPNELIELLAEEIEKRQLERAESLQKPSTSVFMSRDQVAKELFQGNIAPNTVSVWVKQGRLRGYGQGKELWLIKSEVLEDMKKLRKHEHHVA